ncbi:acyltransferase [Caulobacter sp. UNC279MFTsu5.1]|uniref:acyltransferase family protein n=1 Tax=Caulobacter sp. UNC279MFTsu5.1 TaxID=1502775 RepID=UPI0008F3D24F|nr:acyltransferase [Caulobacter sp. UNC279MFTsu5.1]SFK46712.1 Peptidoglycan/LPS O-acetylase OafA/YrhL, contains acyltransferase and SGNH-hydrolase domains [Caulobacter sp. UNC279MFTsu5.1]
MRLQENGPGGGEGAAAAPQVVSDDEGPAEPASIASARYYRPELDVLRFIAFMFVFITHRNDLAPIDPAAHPWFHALTLTGVYGVPVFFLLSAFLITELLERERELTGGINARAFYVRRILRIWPLYFLVFFGLVFLNQVLPGAGANSPAKWLSFMLFSGNWYITFKGWIEYPVNPMWSLSVEEQFYIAIPFLAMLGRRTLIGVNLAVLAVAYGVIVHYARGFTPTAWFSGQWTNSFVQFQFFAGGMLLALLLRGWRPNWPIVVRIALFACAVGLWLVAYTVFGIKADNPQSTVLESLAGWPLVLGGAALMLVSLLGTPRRFLPAPLIYLGRISYGLYLTHIFFFWLVYDKFRPWLTQVTESAGIAGWRDNIGQLIAFVATVCLASLLYRFYETPFLRLKRRFTLVPSRD